MASKKLSQKEVTKRLIRLRNLEKLHSISKQMRSKKDELIKLQSEQIEDLEKGLAVADQLIDAQAIRIAELETMFFGKKKPSTDTSRPDGTSVPNATLPTSPPK